VVGTVSTIAKADALEAHVADLITCLYANLERGYNQKVYHPREQVDVISVKNATQRAHLDELRITVILGSSFGRR
jgi:hypothetical protein